MKTPKFSVKTDLNRLPGVRKLHLERLNPLLLIVSGIILLALLMLSMSLGGASRSDNQDELDHAKLTMSRIGDVVQDFRRVLEDEQVQELAVMAVDRPDQFKNLEQYVRGRIPELIEVQLFEPRLDNLRATDLGPFGYAVLDMLLETQTGIAPQQIHVVGADAYLAMTVRVGEAESPLGYLLIRVNPSAFIAELVTSLPEPGSLVLDQYNGRFTQTYHVLA